MKEYFLVPSYEMQELQKVKDSEDNKIESKPEQKLYKEEILTKQDILELQNQINKLRRDTEVIKSEEQIKTNVDREIDKVGAVDLSKYKDIIESNVPKEIIKQSYELLLDLNKNRQLGFRGNELIVNIPTGEEIKLSDFLRAIFVKNAKVSHIYDFLRGIIKHIKEQYIRNRKALELLIADKKRERGEVFYDSFEDEKSFQDSTGIKQDESKSVGGGLRRKNEAYISWILI